MGYEALGHATTRSRNSAVHTCRNAEELVPAGDSGQTDVIRLSVIDWRLPRFAIRRSADGTFVTALRTIGTTTSDGPRGTR